MKIFKEKFPYGAGAVTLETGRIARQADGAVLVSMGGTVVLVSVVGLKTPIEGNYDFVPLTVNYRERTYAAGRIPGGFLKREGRPSEREVLVSRLMDRPVRPLFPKGFNYEVQIIATVLSLDPAYQPDVLAMIGQSAALALSGLPVQGTLGAARVGYKDGQYLLNPSEETLQDSDLNLVVAGTQEAVMMVESEANMLSESVMLDAVMFGHEQMQAAIKAINALAEQARISEPYQWLWTPWVCSDTLRQQVTSALSDSLSAVFAIADKKARNQALSQLRRRVIETLCTAQPGQEAGGANLPEATAVKAVMTEIERDYVRDRILGGHARIDGRDRQSVRPLHFDVGLLPRVHGSVLFTRGETQAIVSATLGTASDAQIIDDLSTEQKSRFMLHYNFPPFSVGEVGFMSSPKRREIGHGYLAKRALVAVMPDADAFPYSIRVVSETTESNGSSSMAAVCGSSMALMDAGVPLKSAVAGIAMGLIKTGDQFVVLTDILGDEDHLGDMDFKVAGTREGITALQMDIKITGINREIMSQALHQAKAGRLHVLDNMQAAIHTHREEVSPYAPRFVKFKINAEKIRDVIGKGGATIRDITEKTGVSIDISDDGTVEIAAVNAQDAEAARSLIEDITADVEVGMVFEGKIVKIMDFGAFVSLPSGKDGFLHISEIAHRRVNEIREELSEGQLVKVKVVGIDTQRNRVRVSIKALLQQSSA